MKNELKNKKRAKVFLFETSVENQNRSFDIINEQNNQQYAAGLLYLDAILRKNNYDVLTKDYILWSEKNCLLDVKKETELFEPDFIGISMMSMTRVSAYKAIKLVNSINPKVKIIL